MNNRFENFCLSVLKINRCVQKIKNSEMEEYGLKGTHVMCLFFLYQYKNGLTSSELVKLCDEDKAAISRAILLLDEKKYIKYSLEEKKYNAKITLTTQGVEIAKLINIKASRAVSAGGKGLTEEERINFYESMFKIAANLEKYCEDDKNESN